VSSTAERYDPGDPVTSREFSVASLAMSSAMACKVTLVTSATGSEYHMVLPSPSYIRSLIPQSDPTTLTESVVFLAGL